MKKVLLLCGAIMLTGCSWRTAVGFNSQRAALNGTGQITAAEIYDNVPVAQVDDAQATTLQISSEIRMLTTQGKIGEWTLNQLRDYLYTKFPQKYHNFVDQVVKAIGSITYPTEIIGQDNIVRIVEILDGIDTRTAKYDKSRHPVNYKLCGCKDVYRYELKKVKIK